MVSPTSWSAFHASAARSTHKPHQSLYVFGAQYRIARTLRLVVEGHSSANTVEAYHVILRVGLACAALETLKRGLELRRPIPITDDSLATAFRSHQQTRLFDALLEHREIYETHKTKLLDFLAGKHDDLQPIAYTLRNLAFHGAATGNLLSLNKSATRRKLINQLADTALDTADEHFSNYVEALTTQR